MKKKILLLLMILSLFLLSLNIGVKKSEAVVGPLVKIVAGEVADQVLTGIAYKAGQTFADSSAQDKARQRWNMEGYEKAKAYEQMLNEEEKARWREFKQQIENAEIKPHPTKKGWGKVLIKGAAFLTGVDIIYNAYKAFQSGAAGEAVLLGDFYDTPKHPGVSVMIAAQGKTVYFDYKVRYSDGTFVNASYSWGYHKSHYTYDYTVGTLGIDAYVNDGGGLAYLPEQSFKFNRNKTLDSSEGPFAHGEVVNPLTMPITTPEPMRHLPVIPGTTVPDPSAFPDVVPERFIEIEVPLDPSVIPDAEEKPAPISKAEWDWLTDPGAITDPTEMIDPIPIPDPVPIPDPIPPEGTDVDPETLSCDRVKKPDFDSLGNAFSKAFPFSLPFDIYRFFVASFEKIDDKRPEFNFNLFNIEKTITIPKQLDPYVKFFRSFILIVFDISLLYLFARFMRRGTD